MTPRGHPVKNLSRHAAGGITAASFSATPLSFLIPPRASRGSSVRRCQRDFSRNDPESITTARGLPGETAGVRKRRDISIEASEAAAVPHQRPIFPLAFTPWRG